MSRRLDREIERTAADLEHSRDDDPQGDPYLIGVETGLRMALRIAGNFKLAAAEIDELKHRGHIARHCNPN